MGRVKHVHKSKANEEERMKSILFAIMGVQEALMARDTVTQHSYGMSHGQNAPKHSHHRQFYFFPNKYSSNMK